MDCPLTKVAAVERVAVIISGVSTVLCYCH